MNDDDPKIAFFPGRDDRTPAPKAKRADADKPSKRVRIVMGSNVKPQAVTWLWPDWLAHGKLHIIAGRPGSMKTTTALSFCAAVTTGGQWPDDSPTAPGRVLVWSGEDAIDDTLVPRFLAAGGDPNEIGFISGVEEDGKTRTFDLARDMDEVAAACAGHSRLRGNSSPL